MNRIEDLVEAGGADISDEDKKNILGLNPLKLFKT